MGALSIYQPIQAAIAGSILLVGSSLDGKSACEVCSIAISNCYMIIMKSHDRDKRVDKCNSVLIFHLFTAPYSSTLILFEVHVICSA